MADAKSNGSPRANATPSVAGGAFTRGQVITIGISNGPQNVAVPNVDGMTVDQATQTLQQAGFQVTVNQVGPPTQQVFHYSPGGQAPQGTTITIYVGV